MILRYYVIQVCRQHQLLLGVWIEGEHCVSRFHPPIFIAFSLNREGGCPTFATAPS